MNVASTIAFVGLLVFLAHLFAALFSRTRIPDVLLLLLIGLFLGPVFGIVGPGDFGRVGPVFVTIALVIILFEGGIAISLSSLLRSFRGALMLTLVNFIASAALVWSVTRPLAALGSLQGWMLGAILGGTSSAIVIPLLQQLRMQDESKMALFLESALSDVLCIVALFALLGAYRLGEVRVGLLIGNMIAAFMLASVIGILSAAAWSILLNRVRTIQNSIFTTPAFVFIIFGATELLGYNGAISSLAFGVTLGNIRLLRMGFLRKYIHMEPIGLNQTEKVFFSEAVFLLKTFFFVYIGLSIRLTEWWLVSLGSILALLLFAARIPVVRLSVQRATPMKDAAFMAVMVPKGLAAAVLAAVPLQENVLGGEMIQHVTYAVILASVLLTSILIFLLERTPLIGVYGLFFSGFGAPQQEAPKSAAPAPPPFGHRIKNLWRRNPE